MTIFKKLGLTGIALCALCCALPFIGAAIGISSLTAMAMYFEKTGIIILGLSGLAFVYYFWQNQKRKNVVAKNTCDIDCTCKNEKQQKQYESH